MSAWRFILRSLVFHWRMHGAVALGVAAATAVLTGALLVGDSVRGSLRRLTLERLGRIDHLLLADRFFRAQLADELAADAQFQQAQETAVPAVLFPRGTLERKLETRAARAANVLLVGCDARFWELSEPSVAPRRLPAAGDIVLNAPLAEELSAAVGDEVIVRLPKANQVPADSPLGRKTDRVRSLGALRVVDIVPAEGLGRFGLTATQSTPRNAYVALETLPGALGQEGLINAILVAGQRGAGSAPVPRIDESLRPALADYGFSIRRMRRVFAPPGVGPEEVIYDYFQLATDRLLIPREAEAAAQRALAADCAQPVLTYLANTIAKLPAGAAPRDIPYSLVSAVDSTAELGPLVTADGRPLAPLADDEIVLNSWTADELRAAVGDRIRLTYFEPETSHGQLAEQHADFRLRAVVTLPEPATPYRRNRAARFDQRPARTNDPDLTPTVTGVTDQDSISSWEAPFPVDNSRIRPPDDAYWRNHRTTPKAFVSLAAGQRMWGSRFGRVTSFRVPAPAGLGPGSPEEQAFVAQLESRLVDQLGRTPGRLGFRFTPIKQRGVDASSGATPFDVLFLFLSFFVIAAALLLVALLFQLGVERRAAELGTLLAVGLRRQRVGRLLVGEGIVVAAAGGVLGVALGRGYAWLLLAGLRSWWLGAIGTPFLRFYEQPLSLGVGYLSGVLTSLGAIAWSLRRTRTVAVRRLLAGQATVERDWSSRPRRWVVAGALACLAAAIVLACLATRQGGEAQAGSFVGAGTLLLAAFLLALHTRLRSGGRTAAPRRGFGVAGLSWRNAGRNPGRSVMTIGLTAVACFLIVAMSCFRLSPTESGTGGFDLLAEASEPVFADLTTPAGRADALADDAHLLDGGVVLPLRIQSGDDASCNNLYRASQPRVLGVTKALVRHFDDPAVPAFAWAASAAQTQADRANPWRLLAGQPASLHESVPVVIDRNTAMYSLQLYAGIGQEFEVKYDDNTLVKFRVVGLLANSILQGSLLIGEADFTRRFSHVSGYRFFLIRTPAASALRDGTLGRGAAGEGSPPGPPPETPDRVAAALEERLGDEGFDATPAAQRLAELLAVQNTYLSTFQALGALGLLLGTFGIATVQMRNVLERRSELALFRATGFRRRRLAQLVLLENLALLVGGLGIGAVAALLAVLPHMFLGGASVPLRDLAVMLVVVLAVGAASSLFAVRATLQAPLLAALRGE
jgi:ABC-type antimicrobial peptide transport system permease subunit